LQVFNATNAPVAMLPNTTLIVAEGVVSNTTTSNGTNTTAAQQPTARQFEVQLNFTLQPPNAGGAATPAAGSNAAASSATSSPSPLVTPESPGNATVISDNATNSAASGTNSNAGNSGLARRLQQQQEQQQQQQQQPGEFTVGLRVLTGIGTYTDVYLQGLLKEAQAGAGGAAVVSNLSVWVDKTHAGNSSNTTFMEGGPVPLPVNESDAWVVPQQPLGLSVFVDHSVVEVYALGGLARVSSRIYPEADDVAWGMSVWSKPPALAVGGDNGQGGSPAWDVLMNATLWEMQNAWLPPNC
jgi:hypothetical protein